MSTQVVVCSACGDGALGRKVEEHLSACAASGGTTSVGRDAYEGSSSSSSTATSRGRGDDQREVPSFFRKDRNPLQAACLIGFALSYSTSQEGTRTVVDYLGTLFSEQTWALPGQQSLAGFIAGALPTWVHVLLVLMLVALSCWEATRFPRLARHGTWFDLIRTMLQFQGDLLMAPIRFLMPGEKPLLDYQPTTQNERILAMCPSLQHFKQTPWLHNAILSFAVLLWGDMVYGPANRKNVERELVKTADGGYIALDWWKPENVERSERPKRILFVGSTFTGDALVTITREVCDYFTAAGWLCVVHVKRGCGLTMPNVQPEVNAAGDGLVKPWCLSGLDDLELGIDHIAATYPEAVLCGIGLSTGAGQIRNYVNARGARSKLAAAVLVDAAPEWGPAMEIIDRNQPMIARALMSAVRVSFQSACRPLPEKSEPGPGRYLPGGLLEFVEGSQAPAFGFESSPEGMQKYFESCQPASAEGCAIPVLEMLTYNDSLITAEMQDVNRQAASKSPQTIVATTREGTHMVRWEGLLPECWLRRASGEFLEAALRVTGKAP